MRLSKRSGAALSVPSYNLLNTQLEVVHTYKYLGVINSSKLTWGDHINHITSRTSRLLGYIRRLVRCFSINCVVQYFSMVFRDGSQINLGILNSSKPFKSVLPSFVFLHLDVNYLSMYVLKDWV